MVIGIRMRGPYNVAVDKHNSIEVDGERIPLRDIPVVRYAFDSYTEESREAILRLKETFSFSAHVMEYKAGWHGEGDTFEGARQICRDTGLAMMVYIPVREAEAMFNRYEADAIMSIAKEAPFRLMLLDESESLSLEEMSDFKEGIEQVINGVVKASDIGICGSPFSCHSSQSCLPALKVRELMAMQNVSPMTSVPSSAQETGANCERGCACFRYINVHKDLLLSYAAEGSKGKTNKIKDSTKEKAGASKQPSKTGFEYQEF